MIRNFVMDETTVKVMALIQARLQVLAGSLAITLRHPVPHEPFREQWGRLNRGVPYPLLQEASETGAKQIRLMAEMVETQDPARALEIVQ
jgi:hypothetical protein